MEAGYLEVDLEGHCLYTWKLEVGSSPRIPEKKYPKIVKRDKNKSTYKRHDGF